MRTLRIPVNAPTVDSAIIAVRRECERQAITIHGPVVAFPAPKELPDDKAAIVVTKPTGKRTTLLVQVDVTF